MQEFLIFSGRLLRNEREERKVSQAALAEKVGVSEKTVRRFEKMRGLVGTPRRVAMIKRFAEALGVDWRVFYEPDELKKSLNALINELGEPVPVPISLSWFKPAFHFNSPTLMRRVLPLVVPLIAGLVIFGAPLTVEESNLQDIPRAIDQAESVAPWPIGHDRRNVKSSFALRAKLGNPIAQIVLATHYAEGSGGLPQDHAQAVKWCVRAAEQFGTNESSTLLRAHQKGLHVARDHVDPLHWCRRALEQTPPNALSYLDRLLRPA